MATHNITNAYVSADIIDVNGNPIPGNPVAVGTSFTLSAGATAIAGLTVFEDDATDDGYLQDSSASVPEPGDNTQSVDSVSTDETLVGPLTAYGDGSAAQNPVAGDSIFSRFTYTVRVVEPDGTTYFSELVELRMQGNAFTAWAFQSPVPAGSEITVTKVDAGGDTLYSDLDTSDDVVEVYEYNQVISSQTLADQLISTGTASITKSDLTSMQVIDNDGIFQDNNDSANGLQTYDQNMQSLAADFIDADTGTVIDGGFYVLSRQYFDVEITDGGTTTAARLYQIRIVNSADYDGTPVPSANYPVYTYYAFDNDVRIPSSSTVEVTLTGAISGTGDVAHEALFVCYVRGTMIKTPYGEVAVETLTEGDLVDIAGGDIKPVLWTGARQLSRADIERDPSLAPIRISAGSLGKDIPNRDLYVSQQHRIMVSSRIAERMVGHEEILVPAKSLLGLEGISIVTDFDEVEYVHFMFDEHAVVIANGTLSESLFTGPEALKAVDEAARAEILKIFPVLDMPEELSQPKSARYIVKKRQADRIVERHIKNNVPLIKAMH